MLIEKVNQLKGEITVPGDKSISHRAIVFSSLAKGTSEIDGFLLSEDCVSTIDCLRKLGITIEILPNNKVKVHGNGLEGLKPPISNLNTGRSGTALRLILGVLAGQKFNSTLIRDESPQRKSIGKIVRSLKQMGATIHGRDDGNLTPLNILPSRLKGTLHNLSPQDTNIKTPLLVAGLYAEGSTSILEAVRSRDHTELMLSYLGADIEINGFKIVSRPIDNLYAQKINIPGDISLAAYFITAGLIVPNSDITIKNVGINPTRTGIIDVLKAMGGKIEILNERTDSNEKVADIRVTYSQLKATTIDAEIIPRLLDEIPIIAVAAAMAKGTTEIKGLTGFRFMDSGKIKNLVTELKKMGVSIKETEDGILIEGGKPLKGSVIESYNDASIIMAMTIAGLIAEGETMLRKTQILDIVYPEFHQVLNTL